MQPPAAILSGVTTPVTSHAPLPSCLRVAREMGQRMRRLGTAGVGAAAAAASWAYYALKNAVDNFPEAQDGTGTGDSTSDFKSPCLQPPPWGNRAPTRNDVKNEKLANHIDELFRESDEVSGGTAGAVRKELGEGELVGGKSHITKAEERASGLQNLIDSGVLDGEDLQVAEWLMQDLLKALDGDRCP